MKTPFPVTLRESWNSAHIRGTQLPTGCNGGKALTLTGAQKGTTTDGVHCTSGATSNVVVAANAAQNAKAAFHITIWFKLDQTYVAGGGNTYLFTKTLDANNWLRVYLQSATGCLLWLQGDGAGGNEFVLTSTTVSWTAGVWYRITLSFDDTPAQRMLVNGVLEASSAVATPVATPNGGDMVIGNVSDGGTTGIIGTISFVCIGVGATAVVSLTTTEETNLVKGVPPATAKVQYMFLMDEGRGVTATDRGSAGGNGTLDSACTWAYGQVQAPALSLDGLNDYAISASGVYMKEPLTMVVVVKCKHTQDAALANSILGYLRIDANNYLLLAHATAADGIYLSASGGGTSQIVTYTTKPTIGDYRIYICTLTAAGVLTLYVNGLSVAAIAGVGAISAAAAIAYLGATQTPNAYNNDAYLHKGLIEGALTDAQVKTYARSRRDKFNLPITI